MSVAAFGYLPKLGPSDVAQRAWETMWRGPLGPGWKCGVKDFFTILRSWYD